MTLAVPNKGLLTPSGLRPIVAPLVDARRKAGEIFDMIGRDRLASIQVFYNWVLVAKWIPDEIGSILTSAETKRELRWQNRVGLVLKLGPTAFVETEYRHFHGASVRPGDWVYYGASDGVELGIKGPNNLDPVYCLRIEDEHIAGTLQHPEHFY